MFNRPKHDGGDPGAYDGTRTVLGSTPSLKLFARSVELDREDGNVTRFGYDTYRRPR